MLDTFYHHRPLQDHISWSSEASIAFEQYQAAVQCRNSTVLEQAYASGYRTAVQMFAAGLGPQPPVPEHEEDSNG